MKTLLRLLPLLGLLALFALPGLAFAQEGTNPGECSDGIDNDIDTFTDCCDPSCAGVGTCPLTCNAPVCTDSDGDGVDDTTEATGSAEECDPCTCGDVSPADGFDDCSAHTDGGGTLQNDSDMDGICDNGDDEECDGVDNDGDGLVDEGFDTDSDGNTTCGADGVAGTADDDCDDNDPNELFGGTEICDDLDNDCSGTVDDNLPDLDSDGFVVCDLDGDNLDDDCDDNDPAVNQGEPEVCNTVDDNCDGNIDEGLADVDADGFVECDLDGNGTIDDCDDTVAETNQDAPEICDGYDNDCNGSADYSDAGGDELDGDGDLYLACNDFFDTDGTTGFVGGADCADDSAVSSPIGTEICDGFDNDCNGSADFSDANGDELDADADGYIGCQILVTDLAAGILGDGECDDGDPAISPGATEICDFDDIDHDCDGVSDFLETFTAAELSGLPDTDLDGTPDCQDADADNDGYVRPTDCDDQDETVFPDNVETCEDTDQIDSDCDGDVNTASDGSDLQGNTISRFVDSDADGFGAGLAVLFCEEPSADPCTTGVGVCYAFVAGDCDDIDASRNPDAQEACNGIDEDCDGDIDDIGDDPLNPVEPVGCRSMKRDLDGDGIGDEDQALCLCLVGNETETTYQGDTYVLPGGDCDDEDASTHPAFTRGDGIAVSAGEEIQDGNDNDCDGFIYAIELDCDDDGSLAKVPRPGASPLTADNLRLNSCTFAETKELTCWADQSALSLTCDLEQTEVDDGNGGTTIEESGSGLWVLRYGESEDAYGGRYNGGARVYPTTPGCSQVGDCDDFCSLRCADQVEVCDGIDNDCSGVADRQNADSLPDSMLESARLAGIVEVAEGDVDRDGYLDCDNFGSENFEFTFSDLTCAEVVTDATLLTDCSPFCTYASPAGVEVCNGFTDLCGGEAEGTDGDSDGHRTCGAWSDPNGGDAETTDTVFAVVWQAGATFTGTQVPGIIPLLPPRTYNCPGDGSEEDLACEALTNRVLSCDLTLNDALSWLLSPEATDAGTAIDATDVADTQTLLANLALGSATATELVQRVCPVPFDEIGQADQRPPRAQEGSCGIVELTLASSDDDGLEATMEAAVPTVTDTDVFETGTTPFSRVRSCLEFPHQQASRTVWNSTRITDVRYSVAEWECIRMYEGARSCADVESISELAEDWETMLDVTDEAAATVMWTQEIGRFAPLGLTAGTVMKCWGDLTTSSTITEVTGGDCDDTNSASRDQSEGPWDLRALYDLEVDGTELQCAQCLDGIDNNCDGQIDCEDPSCAPCFVGVGGGCYSTTSPCSAANCGGSIAHRQSDEPTALVLALALCALVCGRRRTG